jgi:hypothetical protein
MSPPSTPNPRVRVAASIPARVHRKDRSLRWDELRAIQVNNER